MSQTAKYSMGFTSACLLQQESMLLVKAYDSLRDWKQVREQALSENLLQCRTEVTAKRLVGELIKRLKCLDDSELEFLMDADSYEQVWMLWVAICRSYRFIHDFSVEVIREKYLTLYTEVQQSDYDTFFNQKLDWHEELEKLSPSTQERLRQNLFKMLKEVGILSSDNNICPSLLSSSFVRTLYRSSSKDLSLFPISDSQLKVHIS